MNRRAFVVAMATLGFVALAKPMVAWADPELTEAVLGTAVNDDDKVTNPTDTFTADTPMIYCAFKIEGVEGGATIRGVWIAEDVGKVAPPNYKIDEASLKLTGDGDAKGKFSLSKPNNGFPLGKYRTEIYIGDKLAKTVTFTVK